ncbi:MAG: class I SAM-dependent methyltransferase [Actinomycetota bacterium]|nr:class I SAM-dependent methyltransferase [Actinomycetota bacterium]
MGASTSADDIHQANVRYHDLAAGGYDAKWGIDYGDRGRRQVVVKLAKALGEPRIERFRDGLEIGAGTGYFGLNLLRAGVIERYTATDVSPGMLAVLTTSAARLEVDARTSACNAARLPFPDDSFDLVFGHAVLHHLPDLDASFSEFMRVLRPGGAIAFCGEPSRYGDRIAELPKRAARALAPAWRALVGARAAERNGHHGAPEEERLERVVDVHAFTPATLAGHVRRAGFTGVRVSGEELAASLFGWANRSFEATAEPADVPWIWHQYAYRGYLGLQALDRALLEPRLPAALFYNLLVSARA